MNYKLSETVAVITKRSINDKTFENFGNELATISWDKIIKGITNKKKGHSTLSDKISLGIFLDLSKAIDTVNHYFM